MGPVNGSKIPRQVPAIPLPEKLSFTKANERKRRLELLETEMNARRNDATLKSRSAHSYSMGLGNLSAPLAISKPSAVHPPTTVLQDNAPGQFVIEDTWEYISANTGLEIEDVLSKKFTFAKGTRPEKKLETILPAIKQLKAIGNYLVIETSKLTEDSKRWESSHVQLTNEYETLRFETTTKINSLEKELADKSLKLSKKEEELQEAARRVAECESELSSVKESVAAAMASLDSAEKQLADRAVKVRELEDLIRTSQQYNATLQQYNTSLQADLQIEKAKRDEAQKAKTELQEKVAMVGGGAKGLEQQLEFERAQFAQIKVERDGAVKDLAELRVDLASARSERERLHSEATTAKTELDRIRSVGGKSLEKLEEMTNDKATMECQLATQTKLLAQLRSELAVAREAKTEAVDSTQNLLSELTTLKADALRMQQELAIAEKKVHDGEILRKKLHNIIQELKGNIRVFCRVRPLRREEAGGGGGGRSSFEGALSPSSSSSSASSGPESSAVVYFPGDDLAGRAVVLTVPAPGSMSNSNSNNNNNNNGSSNNYNNISNNNSNNNNCTNANLQKYPFTFDRVFNGRCSQEEVFADISELVQSALDGQKVCIFAYGQTGSGKTHTMIGRRDDPGMIPRAVRQLFEGSRTLASQNWTFAMQASMLEIYNEEIKDLLSSGKGTGGGGQSSTSNGSSGGYWNGHSNNNNNNNNGGFGLGGMGGSNSTGLSSGKKHQILHGDGNTTVTDLTVVDVGGEATVEKLLQEAMEKRSVGCTALNEQSSRSHMVFTLRIEGSNSETGARVNGVLNLIDLAGSERVKESGAQGQALREAQAINKSLASLGDVIAALATKEKHIPFRNSKLTYLLQPCLGGDAKTLMFVNLSPAKEYVNESLCSLRFAAKVNACEINTVKKNILIPRE